MAGVIEGQTEAVVRANLLVALVLTATAHNIWVLHSRIISLLDFLQAAENRKRHGLSSAHAH